MRRNCYSALCLCKAVLRSSASQTSELVGTTWDFVKMLILMPEVCGAWDPALLTSPPWGEAHAAGRRTAYVARLFSHCFSGGSAVKTLPANAGDTGLIPGSGRSPGEGNGNALQYSCLGNPKDRGAWWAIESMGSKKIGHDLATKQQHNKSISPQNLTTDVGQCDQTPTKQQAMWGPCLACTSCVSGT